MPRRKPPTGVDSTTMAGVEPYWRKDPDRLVPFSTLLNFVEKYCHPEIRNDNYDLLISRAQMDRPGDAEMKRFKHELTRLLRGDREGLHPQALTQATWYDEEDDSAFLQQLWRDLYPDEPVPSPPHA